MLSIMDLSSCVYAKGSFYSRIIFTIWSKISYEAKSKNSLFECAECMADTKLGNFVRQIQTREKQKTSGGDKTNQKRMKKKKRERKKNLII